MSPLTVSIEGIELRFLAQRGLYWPEQETLFIADTHFGKEATFRSAGIAAPRGCTGGTLASISNMLRQCHASRLVLLGDMFHAKTSISEDIRNSLDTFFVDHSEVKFSLVLGNHDLHIKRLPSHWPIEILETGTMLGRISISHVPRAPEPGSDLLLCGHIHPAYRLVSRSDSIGKLPCFWLSQNQLVLPAIGEFTGTEVIKPKKSDRTWVIADGQIVEIKQPSL
jgi:DNA ligase-associated metallophosphoesterase